MAKSKSLTVLTVMSSIFALQACSEGITSAEEALTNLSNQTSSEATDPLGISIGAANPTGTETTIPDIPSVVTNYTVNNFNVLPDSSSPSSPDEELEPGNGTPPDTDLEEVTDTPPETDFEVVTDLPSETDSEVVTDLPSETDSEEVTDTPPETDSKIVTDIEPETEGKKVASVDYTPIPEAPTEGELVPFGSTIQFAWSIPVALFGTVTGFDISIADASEGVVSYRDNGVAMSSCSDDGLCTHEINSADLPIPEGDNIWSISSLGGNVSLNIAEATFTLDENPDAQIANGVRMLSPAAGYVADSPSVDFSWEDLSNPGAGYDLHIYSDAARTQKVTGTNGVIFDTDHIGKATSHTFTDDPSDGAKRYGRLIQWDDPTYVIDSKREILFEYTAHTKKSSPKSTDVDFLAVKAIADERWKNSDNFSTNSGFPLKTEQGYHALTVMLGAAQMYKTTNDTTYMDKAIAWGNKWIASGVDEDKDGFLDWWGNDNDAYYYNIDHHEWRAAAGLADVLIEMQRTGYEGASGTKKKWISFLKQQVWTKWAPGHNQTDHQNRYKSNRTTQSTSSAGRWALITMALDQTHASPGNNEYYDYVMNSSAFVSFFTTYINLSNSGKPNVTKWTNGDNRGGIGLDTQHSNDMLYAVMRAKQLGYNPGGKMDQFLSAYEAHLNSIWFPTSAGFKPYANGSGATNEWHWSSSHGHALSAALSPALRARWVDYFLNKEPTFTYNNDMRLVWMAGGLLYVLNGGVL